MTQNGYNIVGVTRNWLFGISGLLDPPAPENATIMAINREGVMHQINALDKYDTVLHFCVGNENVFVVWESPLSKGCFLTIEDTSGDQPLRTKWKKKLFDYQTGRVVAATIMPGFSPDTAAFVIARYNYKVFYIILVNALGEAFRVSEKIPTDWLFGQTVLIKQIDKTTIEVEHENLIGEKKCVAQLTGESIAHLRVIQPVADGDITIAQELSLRPCLFPLW